MTDGSATQVVDPSKTRPHQLVVIGELKLALDVCLVRLDCLHADDQLLSDRSRTQAFADVFEYF